MTALHNIIIIIIHHRQYCKPSNFASLCFSLLCYSTVLSGSGYRPFRGTHCHHVQDGIVSNRADNNLNFPTPLIVSSTASRTDHVLPLMYRTHAHKHITLRVTNNNLTDSLKLELKDKFDLNPQRDKSSSGST
jgi:hypothetical protein